MMMANKYSEDNWVRWLQSIEDAAKHLKMNPGREKYFEQIVQIDKDLWDMDRTITVEEREK